MFAKLKENFAICETDNFWKTQKRKFSHPPYLQLVHYRYSTPQSTVPKEYISIKNTKQPLLVFLLGTFYPRKQEAVEKSTSELLSAVLRSLLFGGVCVYLYLYLVYTIHCTLYRSVGKF